MNRHLLTTKQAADILGVSQSFLERDRWAGAQIPFIRVGKRCVRYRNKDLDAFIESRMFTSTSAYSEQDKSVQA